MLLLFVPLWLVSEAPITWDDLEGGKWTVHYKGKFDGLLGVGH
jgi:hypothetical protein